MTVSPYDEVGILNEDKVIRRVNTDEHVVFDRNTQTKRLSSKLFSPSSVPDGGMSVDLPKLMEADGVSPEDFVTNPKYLASVQFDAGSARSQQLRIGYDPILNQPDSEDNPYHGEVWGSIEKPNRFSNGQKRALMRASTWLVPANGVTIPQ